MSSATNFGTNCCFQSTVANPIGQTPSPLESFGVIVGCANSQTPTIVSLQIVGNAGCQLRSSLSFRGLDGLQQVYMTKCSFVGATVDWNSLSANPNLASLSLPSNGLTGLVDIPTTVLPSLSHLDLSNNYFFGQVPKSVLNHPLKHLDLSNNQFTGTMPSFEGSDVLQYVNLSSSGIYGLVSGMQQMPKLTQCVLSEMQCHAETESIPDTCNLPICGLGASPAASPTTPTFGQGVYISTGAAITIGVGAGLVLYGLIAYVVHKHKSSVPSLRQIFVVQRHVQLPDDDIENDAFIIGDHEMQGQRE
ncbi:hypothetical protein EDD86DRAFT_202639 [Gorgonomyces haynaldii]|nr:hypothetical protein EDD86DRAFT_202639 [Gorgonomyces haynaldii]